MIDGSRSDPKRARGISRVGCSLGMLLVSLCLLLPREAEPNPGQQPSAKHHCTGDEYVLFSCAVGEDDYASLCGKTMGNWTQFRRGPFGKAKYAFPEDGDRSVFKYEEDAWASGKETSLSFTAQGLSHRIAIAYGSGINGPSNNYERLRIEDPRKRKRDTHCVGPVVGKSLAGFRQGWIASPVDRTWLSARQIGTDANGQPVTRIQFAAQAVGGPIRFVSIDRVPGTCTAPKSKTAVAGPQALSCRAGESGRDYRIEQVTRPEESHFAVASRPVSKGYKAKYFDVRMRIYETAPTPRKPGSPSP